MLTGNKITERFALIVILFIGIGLRSWHIGWGLPELYDEAYPFKVAWWLWQWDKPGLDFNPHFFNYPALTIYLNFALQGVQYIVGHLTGAFPTPEAFHQAFIKNPGLSILLSRSLNVLFETGTIVLLFLIAKRLAGEVAGLVSAALGSINLLLIKQSYLINVDTPLAFFALLSILFCLRLLESGERRWYLLAGLGVGLAAASKYTGAFLIAAIIAAHALRTHSVKEALFSFKDLRLVSALLVAIAIFFAINPYAMISSGEFFRDFGFEESHMAAGHLGIDPGRSTFSFYFLQTLPSHLGWILWFLVAASMISLLIGHARRDLLLLFFPLVYLPVVCTWSMRADRYLLPIIPLLLLIGVTGVTKAMDILSRKKTNAHPGRYFGNPAFRAGVLVVMGLIAAIQPLSAVLRYEDSFSQPDTRSMAREWILKNLPPGSSIATIQFGLDLPESTYTVLWIPFLPIEPDRIACFYDTRWYEDLDLVVGSDFDYARYRDDPNRYKTFLDYYGTLRKDWKLIAEFTPSGNQPGPAIWLYRHPDPSTNGPFDENLLKQLDAAPESSRVSSFMRTLTTVLVRKNKLQRAEQLAQEVVEVEENAPDAHNVLAFIETNLNKGEEALAEVDRSLTLHPDQPDVIGLRGHILLQLKRMDEAEPCLKQALARNPNLDFAYDDLFMIYYDRRDKKNAIDILSRQLHFLPPSSEKANMVERRLQQLRALP